MQSFQHRRELPPEEFQFSIRKQWKTLTDRQEGDRKVNQNSPSDQTEGENYHFIKTNIYPQRLQVRAINQLNSNSRSSMVKEEDKEKDKYYVLTKNISGGRIVKPNRFGQSATIALGILTCQFNTFPQTSRAVSI